MQSVTTLMTSHHKDRAPSAGLGALEEPVASEQNSKQTTMPCTRMHC
jgi:hypothetical protein